MPQVRTISDNTKAITGPNYQTRQRSAYSLSSNATGGSATANMRSAAAVGSTAIQQTSGYTSARDVGEILAKV